MSLPADVTRCHDGGCSERHECRRWLERDTGRSHVASLFPYDISLRERCPHRIPETDDGENNDTG